MLSLLIKLYLFLLYSDPTPASIITYVNGVEKLSGDNKFAKWSREIELILVMMDKNHSMRDRAPVAPVAQGTDDTTLAERTAAYEKEKERWERSNRVALMVMDLTISPTIRGALEKEPNSAKSFMTSIEEYFKGSTKSNASTLLSQLMSAKYNGQGNVREHIMGMVDIRDKLKDLDCPLNDATLLHHVMISLPPVFEPFKVNYNGSDKQWDITTLVSKCAQEEQRLRSQHPELVNHVSQDGSKNKNKRVFRSKKDKKGKKTL